MKYPSGCDSPRKKTEFLYKAQEELRLLHNIFSRWLHEGMNEALYKDSLPEFIKLKYPFASKLTEEMWNKFEKEDFTPRSNTICQEICVQRAELKNSSNWSIDIGEI